MPGLWVSPPAAEVVLDPHHLCCGAPTVPRATDTSPRREARLTLCQTPTWAPPTSSTCGTTTHVTARLATDRTSRPATWEGEIRSPDTDLRHIALTGTKQLRLPDGTTAQFTTTDTAPRTNPDTLQTKGTGPAPF